MSAGVGPGGGGWVATSMIYRENTRRCFIGVAIAAEKSRPGLLLRDDADPEKAFGNSEEIERGFLSSKARQTGL